VEKQLVLEEIFKLVGSEVLTLDLEGKDPELKQTRAARQLKRAVDILPDPMTQKEALNLFRNILLTVQSAMMISNEHVAPVTLADSPHAASLPGSQGPEGDDVQANGGSLSRPSPTIRATSRAEDVPQPRGAGRRLHPALAAPVQEAQLFDSAALSRKELEGQSAELRQLCEELAQSTRHEEAVVRELEHEALARGRGLHGLRVNDDEVKMQRRLQEQQEDVKGHEELILMQRREIEALLAKRSREETEADELHRQARELTTELRSCRRSCGSLESEIASEEARAAALREAFEGRRARFATAETAARNAELSTMRATRRRIAAEIMARRETEAVQEAQDLRQEYRARAEAHCEVITSEIAEVRTNDLFKGHNSVNQAEATSASEEAEAEAASREMSELQAAIFTLEQQTAVRESELHAMQRRKLRGSSKRRDGSGSRTPTTATQEKDSEQAALQATELRVAEGRQREQVLRQQLQRMGQPRGQEVQEASSAWARARELALEVGEAQAAWARRQAEQGGNVVGKLKARLQEATEQEATNLEELAQLRQENARLAEQSLRKAEGGASQGSSSWLSLPSWLGGSGAGDGSLVAA